MAKIRKSFTHGRSKQVVAERRSSLTLRRPKPPKPKTSEEIQPDIERCNVWLEKYLNSPEFAEECRKADEKERRKEERERARQAASQAACEERRRNPKSPIDAYYNHMDNCAFSWLKPKERRAWKKDNPTFEFNGVTYRDHWSPQRSNSGKTTRWIGYLTGSDGSSIMIKDEHINNRRNDPERNWGLPE